MELNELAKTALNDKNALEDLLKALQNQIYRLSLRMLGHPQDAEDATQEILLKIVANLAQFEGKSQITTWVYTISTRFLLTTRQRKAEEAIKNAEGFVDWLDNNLASTDYGPADAAETKILENECRIGCTIGMLMCLNREQRIALILGDVLELPDRIGAEICGISKAAFRKRLERAREVIRFIIAKRCGLIDQANPCRCNRQIQGCLDHGFIDKNNLTFAKLPNETKTLEQVSKQLDDVFHLAKIISNDDFSAPEIWQKVIETSPDFVD